MEPKLESEEWRQNFLKDLESNIEEKSYPECDSSLAYDLLEAKFLIELSYREEFNDFGSQIYNMINRAMEPFQYEKRNSIEELTVNTFALRYWRELMAQSVVINGQSVHGGDVLNKAISSWNLDEKRKCFDILKNDFIDIDSNFSASDVEEVDFPENIDEKEVLDYNILMISFDRLKDSNYITLIEIKKP